MTYTTVAQSELLAINEILTSLGQSPVTSLDETNPDVAIITSTLNTTSREVQAEGWAFNLEKDYTFFLNGSGEVTVPTNVLHLDLIEGPTYAGLEATVRNGKLYNKTDHTFDWSLTDDSLRCDVLWWFELSDLPRPVYDYIVAKAATMCATKIIGDPNQFQLLQQREAYTRSFALEYECEQGDYSIFGNVENTKFYSSYQPYKALVR